MRNSTSYVSDKLCHFVGSSCLNDDARYEVLTKVLKSGFVAKNPQDPHSVYRHWNVGFITIDENGESFHNLDCICFCDIPDESLHIHTGKYGHFGIGFGKDFLVSYGARPVTYIPARGQMNIISGESLTQKNTMRTLIELSEDSYNVAKLMTYISKHSEIVEYLKNHVKDNIYNWKINQIGMLSLYTAVNSILEDVNEIAQSVNCLLDQNFLYNKYYDHTLSENDPENYYYEREWRVLRTVFFTMNDIVTVYLPSAYVKRFVNDFPEYNGGFYMLD